MALRALAPKAVLHAEGVALLAVAAWQYHALGGPLWLFVAAGLAPDLAMVGYLAGERAGSAAYNLAHTLVFPLVLAALGLATGERLALLLALPWLFHIGADRALGYGLKYPTGFKDTHLGRV